MSLYQLSLRELMDLRDGSADITVAQLKEIARQAVDDQIQMRHKQAEDGIHSLEDNWEQHEPEVSEETIAGLVEEYKVRL